MPLYSCPECGDLGCGAVTVKLTVESDRVVWSDWDWQTNYELGVDGTSLDGIPRWPLREPSTRASYRMLGSASPSHRRSASGLYSRSAKMPTRTSLGRSLLKPRALATGAITDLFPDPGWDQWDGLPPDARDAHASLAKYEQGRKRKTGMAVEVPVTAEGLRLLAAWGSHPIKTELTREDDNPLLTAHDEGDIFGDVTGEEALNVQRALTERGLPFEWRPEPRRPSLLKRLLRRT